MWLTVYRYAGVPSPYIPIMPRVDLDRSATERNASRPSCTPIQALFKAMHRTSHQGASQDRVPNVTRCHDCVQRSDTGFCSEQKPRGIRPLLILAIALLTQKYRPSLTVIDSVCRL